MADLQEMNPFSQGAPREREQEAYEKYCKFVREHGTSAEYNNRVTSMDNPWQAFCDKMTKKEARWENFYQQFEEGKPCVWLIPNKFPS